MSHNKIQCMRYICISMLSCTALSAMLSCTALSAMLSCTALVTLQVTTRY